MRNVASVHQPVLDLVRARLVGRPEILEAYCFGSYARGEAATHSDLDIAVYVDRDRLPPAPYGYAADLITELMPGLGFMPIHLVVLNDAPPLLYHRVLRDGERLLSRDLAATTTREGRSLSRYCDYQQQLRIVDGYLAQRLADGSFGH